jgi:hypothetical protein
MSDTDWDKYAEDEAIANELLNPDLTAFDSSELATKKPKRSIETLFSQGTAETHSDHERQPKRARVVDGARYSSIPLSHAARQMSITVEQRVLAHSV